MPLSMKEQSVVSVKGKREIVPTRHGIKLVIAHRMCDAEGDTRNSGSLSIISVIHDFNVAIVDVRLIIATTDER